MKVAPEVFINMGMSSDGKIATANRRIQTFGSEEDEERLFALRATADAVMSGSNTVNTANYDLGTGGEKFCRIREANRLEKHNLRIIVSGRGNIDPEAAIFQHKFSPIIILVTDLCSELKLEALRKRTPHVHAFGESAIDWERAFAFLHEEWGVRRLACEGGSTLNDEIMRGGWVKELYLTISPVIVGGAAAPTICGGLGIDRLDLAVRFQLKKMRKTDKEVFLDFISQMP